VIGSRQRRACTCRISDHSVDNMRYCIFACFPYQSDGRRQERHHITSSVAWRDAPMLRVEMRLCLSRSSLFHFDFTCYRHTTALNAGLEQGKAVSLICNREGVPAKTGSKTSRSTHFTT